MSNNFYQTSLDFVDALFVKEILPRGSSIIFIVLLAFIIQKISLKIINSAIKKTKKGDLEIPGRLEKRVRTLGGVLKDTTKVIIWLIASIMILAKTGVNVTPIITGAGILGLAISFGTQTLVKDVVTGFFIFLENQYNKGDFIKTAGLEGEVNQINLRTTILKDKDGSIHIIPNSQITKVTRLKRKTIKAS